MGTSFLCVFWYLTLYRKLVPFSIPKGIIVYTKYYTLSSAGQQYNKKEQHYVEIPKNMSNHSAYPWCIHDKLWCSQRRDTLLNRSADGKVKIALNTTTEAYGTYKSCTNYISINMTIIGRTDCALTYKNMIDDIFAAGKIDGYVNMSLKGELNGAVNYYERNRLADELLDILDAKVVSENRENDLFTIYAYTGLVDEYVMSAGRKININIVQEYDSVANKTVIYLSTPLNNLDY